MSFRWHSCSLCLCLPLTGMTIPDEDTEAGQTGKYCLVAIGRLQVCGGCNKSSSLFVHTETSSGTLCAVCHFNNAGTMEQKKRLHTLTLTSIWVFFTCFPQCPPVHLNMDWPPVSNHMDAVIMLRNHHQ